MSRGPEEGFYDGDPTLLVDRPAWLPDFRTRVRFPTFDYPYVAEGTVIDVDHPNGFYLVRGDNGFEDWLELEFLSPVEAG